MDKASDNGPRGGYPPRGGGIGGYGMRGGYGGIPAPGMPQMAYGYPQQSHPMAAHPQLYAAQQQYGRGGYPPQPAMNYNTMPQQGESTNPFTQRSSVMALVNQVPRFAREKLTLAYG